MNTTFRLVVHDDDRAEVGRDRPYTALILGPDGDLLGGSGGLGNTPLEAVKDAVGNLADEDFAKAPTPYDPYGGQKHRYYEEN